MKLLKYMLCASMCMSFGVAHAADLNLEKLSWKILTPGMGRVPSSDYSPFLAQYTEDQDFDNLKALITEEGTLGVVYMTARDCIKGEGIIRTISGATYRSFKFNLAVPSSAMLTSPKLLTVTAMKLCAEMVAKEKFSESESLKVSENIVMFLNAHALKK